MLCALWAFLISVAITGCSPRPVSHEASKEISVDAMIRSGDSWFLFRFNGLRYLPMSSRLDAWNKTVFATPERWLNITSPGGAFRPVQAIAGTQGHFFLLDAAQGRLCLYDTAAQLLSTFPLPQSLLPWNPGRMGAFAGSDGSFTFLDYFVGEALQFADRGGREGGTDWVVRNRFKLPMGMKDCIQEPGQSGLACVLPEGPAHFDASLNRVGVHALPLLASSMFWDKDAASWGISGFDLKSGGKRLFRFWPMQRRLETAD